jgi:hypothetical protein
MVEAAQALVGGLIGPGDVGQTRDDQIVGTSGTKEVVVSPQPMTAPSTVVLREDLLPVCPFCEAEVPEIYARKPRRAPFGIGRGFVFFCPHCRKVMGVSVQWYPFPG